MFHNWCLTFSVLLNRTQNLGVSVALYKAVWECMRTFSLWCIFSATEVNLRAVDSERFCWKCCDNSDLQEHRTEPNRSCLWVSYWWPKCSLPVWSKDWRSCHHCWMPREKAGIDSLICHHCNRKNYIYSPLMVTYCENNIVWKNNW